MRRLLRTNKWWHYKVPPLLAVAYFALQAGGDSDAIVPLPTALGSISLFLVAVIGIAGFGHLFTDVFDVHEDQVNGRENAWARLGALQRVAVMGTLVAAAWLPWLALPIGHAGLALVALEFVLFALYAIPPIRLKERGFPGIVADALYAHVVPVLVTWLTFSHIAGNTTPVWSGILLAVWSMCVGMRHLLQHQALDLEQDRLAQVMTFAVRNGRERTLHVIVRRILPVEMAVFLALMTIVSMRLPVVALGFLCYVIWETAKLRFFWIQSVDPFGRLSLDELSAIHGTRFLSRFNELWLPLLMIYGLVARSPAYALLLLLHVALFKNALGTLLFQDLPLIMKRLRRIA